MALNVSVLVLAAGGLSAAQKMLLMAMADHADENGQNVYPSKATLAIETGLSERSVQTNLRYLLDCGLIVVTRPATQHYPTHYALQLDALRRLRHPDYHRKGLEPQNETSQESSSFSPETVEASAPSPRGEAPSPLQRPRGANPAIQGRSSFPSKSPGEQIASSRGEAASPKPSYNHQLKSNHQIKAAAEARPLENAPTETPAAAAADLGAVWEALEAAGIGKNARSEALARLPHVTPETVRAHHLRLIQRGLGQNAGLLIRILEAGDPAPALNARGHLEGCSCDSCLGLVYATEADADLEPVLSPAVFEVSPAAPEVLQPAAVLSPAAPAALPSNVPCPAISQPAFSRGRTPAEAFRSALEQLTRELPITYRQYLDQAALIDFDPEACLFSIAAAGAYARDWLTSRIQSQLTRLLTGITGQAAQVQFVAIAA